MTKTDYDYLILFSNQFCPQCRALKESLKKTGLEYEESDNTVAYDVDHYPTLILMEAKKNHVHKEKARLVGYQTPEQLNEFVKFTSCGRRLDK